MWCITFNVHLLNDIRWILPHHPEEYKILLNSAWNETAVPLRVQNLKDSFGYWGFLPADRHTCLSSGTLSIQNTHLSSEHSSTSVWVQSLKERQSNPNLFRASGKQSGSLLYWRILYTWILYSSLGHPETTKWGCLPTAETICVNLISCRSCNQRYNTP